MGILHGTIVDAASGEKLDAKVHVLNAMGNFAQPRDALLKRGPGTPFFFSDGEFEVSGSRGRTDVLVERGTEYLVVRSRKRASPSGKPVDRKPGGCRQIFFSDDDFARAERNWPTGQGQGRTGLCGPGRRLAAQQADGSEIQTV